MAERVLRPAPPIIAPSMLKCNFSDLGGEAAALEAGGSKILHLDVMDGHFVPNLSYGALVIESYRKSTNLLFDAHLMISDPAQYLDDYIKAGCDWITFHIEATLDPVPLLRKIRAAGRLAGIAINPDTPVSALKSCVGECDLVLVMSVHPGFGGQAFIPNSTAKVREVRELVGSDTLISVDGGIGPKTIPEVSAAGADVFVAGSSIFDHPDYQHAIQDMEQLASGARTSPAGLKGT